MPNMINYSCNSTMGHLGGTILLYIKGIHIRCSEVCSEALSIPYPGLGMLLKLLEASLTGVIVSVSCDVNWHLKCMQLNTEIAVGG